MIRRVLRRFRFLLRYLLCGDRQAVRMRFTVRQVAKIGGKPRKDALK